MSLLDDELVPQFWRPVPGERAVIRFVPFKTNDEEDEMPDVMSHERMRWGYMTHRDLAVRLRRITHQDKLSCFMRLCTENWSGRQNGRDLFMQAQARARELGFMNLVREAERIIASRQEADRIGQLLATPPPARHPLRGAVVDLTAHARRIIDELAGAHSPHVDFVIMNITEIPAHGSPTVTATCPHCSKEITEIPVPRDPARIQTVVYAADRLIRKHRTSLCEVLHPKEPERPKIRVIRMGRKK